MGAASTVGAVSRPLWYTRASNNPSPECRRAVARDCLSHAAEMGVKHLRSKIKSLKNWNKAEHALKKHLQAGCDVGDKVQIAAKAQGVFDELDVDKSGFVDVGELDA